MLNNKKILNIIIFIISCSKEDKVPNDTTSSKKWEGPIISFIKKDEANPTDKNNQDSITANVIITRGNDGGQIFNLAQEKSSDKYKSPFGTEWAIGTLDQIDSLTFESFRSTVNPQFVVGRKLVMHLIKEDIYISVEFKSWSSEKKGDSPMIELRNDSIPVY